MQKVQYEHANDAGTPIALITNARHHQPGDVESDGDCDSADKAIVDGLISGGAISIALGSYRAEADLNRDGSINNSDSTLANTSQAAIAAGIISRDAHNAIGWDG